MQPWEIETFLEVRAGRLHISGVDAVELSSENGTQAMTCTRVTASGWEAFGLNQ